MGTTKVTENTTTQSTSTPTPTAEETALNQRNLRIAQATEGSQTQAQLSGLNVVNQLLTGQIPGGIYQNMAGIDPNAIATQATQMMRSSKSGLQGAGLLDSGVGDRAIAKDLSSNLLFPAAQYNVGALQNLMNLALTGQAQVQAPIQNNVNNLSNSLAGLRSTTTTGSSNQTTSRNPFLESFYSSAGKSVGSGTFGNSAGWWS